ncbi:MAG TPA: hypothetical protein VGO66_09180 [Solirubrobacterales bacterium]|jgi:hypothetical protein|nr:hypothetical protein [Solirubrobacterales bacterium]
MGRELRHLPALAFALIALFVALGGTVFAAAKISGKTIKVKSLPGNRLKPGSVPGNRLKPGAIPGSSLAPGSITGVQIDTATLGQVPTAVYADSAGSARDAETALNAVNAVSATKVNGHSAGCAQSERFFAGSCWQPVSDAALSAPAAAASCATRGGELPSALLLAAFSQQPGVVLAAGGEWSSDIATYSGVNSYSVATVGSTGEVGDAVSTLTKKFRCVIPLVT